MTFSLATRVRVSAIREHHRTISGRRDPISGQTTMEHINLGYFLHLDFEGGTFAFSLGPSLPEGIAVGDSILVSLHKEP